MSTELEPRPRFVAICVEFLSQCEATKKPVKTYTTYGLKHVIEEWAGEYIHETECVIGLMESGFELHWSGHGITFSTNIDVKSIKRAMLQGRRSR